VVQPAPQRVQQAPRVVQPQRAPPAAQQKKPQCVMQNGKLVCPR
jgi:hypothetical protein